MAIITNTFQSTSAVGNRETLSDVVSRITPEDTPIYSDSAHPALEGKHPEWEIDTLRAPAANAQLEGDEFAFAAIVVPARVGMYTQILREGYIVSGTQEKVLNAGSVEKLKEAKIKSAVALKKDVELAIVTNTASVAGATRLSGGLPSWITTNVSRGAGGANGGYSAGSGLTVAETTGTLRAFTKVLLDAVMQLCYTSGANVRNVYLSPYNKSVFVTFMSDTNVAAYRYAVDNGQGNSIVANADYYEGPYGKVRVIPNRVMAIDAARARRVFLTDSEMLEWGWLRRMQAVPNLAVTGDAEKGMILGEGCLKVRNEAGLGVIADVFGLTAST
jgi:hypothetical protein